MAFSFSFSSMVLHFRTLIPPWTNHSQLGSWAGSWKDREQIGKAQTTWIDRQSSGTWLQWPRSRPSWQGPGTSPRLVSFPAGGTYALRTSASRVLPTESGTCFSAAPSRPASPAIGISLASPISLSLERSPELLLQNEGNFCCKNLEEGEPLVPGRLHLLEPLLESRGKRHRHHRLRRRRLLAERAREWAGCTLSKKSKLVIKYLPSSKLP